MDVYTLTFHDEDMDENQILAIAAVAMLFLMGVDPTKAYVDSPDATTTVFSFPHKVLRDEFADACVKDGIPMGVKNDEE